MTPPELQHPLPLPVHWQLCALDHGRGLYEPCRQGRWRAYSAGSKPAGAPNPLALATLKAHDVAIGAPRSKSWDEFTGPTAPRMDVVVTVCDSAASESCPVWPRPAGRTPQRKLHWSFPDPAGAEGSEVERRAAFEAVFLNIKARIDSFLIEDGS